MENSEVFLIKYSKRERFKNCPFSISASNIGSAAAAASAYDQATDALGCYGLAATLTGSTDPLSSLKNDSR